MQAIYLKEGVVQNRLMPLISAFLVANHWYALTVFFRLNAT
ncbi:hypothetical protein [Methylicorpusculum oleiharenae]|nr:hypothetical protein [Methylicorpusculum oleiharenae]